MTADTPLWTVHLLCHPDVPCSAEVPPTFIRIMNIHHAINALDESDKGDLI